MDRPSDPTSAPVARRVAGTVELLGDAERPRHNGRPDDGPPRDEVRADSAGGLGGPRRTALFGVLLVAALGAVAWLILGSSPPPTAVPDGGATGEAPADRLSIEELTAPSPTVRWETPPKVAAGDGSLSDAVLAAARLVIHRPGEPLEVLGLDGSTGPEPPSFELALLAVERPPDPPIGDGASPLDETALAPTIAADSAAAGRRIVRVGDGLVVVEDGIARTVPPAGEEARAVGLADVLLASEKPGRVWLGHTRGTQDGLTTFQWTEVDVDGTIHRSTSRQLPLEFSSPGLVWGFNSGIWRLLDDGETEGRPWKLIAYGHPVASGPRDVVINLCSTAGDAVEVGHCRRIWYDAVTGERRGGLYDDLADRLPVHSLGILSPDGRYLVRNLPSNGGTVVYSVAGATAITDECLDPDAMSWLDNPGLLACRVAGGILVYGLDGVQSPPDAVNAPLIPRSFVAVDGGAYDFELIPFGG